MSAFDTDVLTLIFAGFEPYRQRLNAIPRDEQFVPIVVLEEHIRGRLNTIRQAESGKSKISLSDAYDLLQRSLLDSRSFRILAFTPEAERLVDEWRAAKIRIGTQDLRIAAICIAHNVKLATRNKRDFDKVPGLNLEVWN